MTAKMTLLILLGLFCGTYGQDDAVIDLQELLSGEEHVTKEEHTEEIEIILETPDDVDDDVLDLELASTELRGGCSHGVCKYCAHALKQEVCFKASLLKLGFELEILVNDHDVLDKKVTVQKKAEFCFHAPVLGKACIDVYNVNLKQESACIRLVFKIKVGPIHKKVHVKIACFKFKKQEEAPLTFSTLLQTLLKGKLNQSS